MTSSKPNIISLVNEGDKASPEHMTIYVVGEQLLLLE